MPTSHDIANAQHDATALAQRVLLYDTNGNALVTASGLYVQGPAAEDAAAAGNPLLSGGRYDSSARTLETGDVGAVALNASAQLIVDTELPAAIAGADNMANPTAPQVLAHLMGLEGATWDRLLAESGNLRIALYNGGTQIGNSDTPADALTQPSSILDVLNFPHLWNGATWDRQRGNHVVAVETAKNVTSDTVSATQTNYNGRGLVGHLEVTAQSGTTPTLDCQLQIYNQDGDYYRMVDSAGNTVQWPQITTSLGTFSLFLYPGISELLTGNHRKHSGILPRRWGILYEVGGGTPNYTFDIDAEIIL